MDPRSERSTTRAREQAVGRLWDALQESGALEEPGVTPEEIETIAQVHDADDSQSPDDDLVQSIWMRVQADVESNATVAARKASNGHGLIQAVAFEGDIGLPQAPAPEEARPRRRKIESVRFAVWRGTRTVAVSAIAGFIAGVMVIGIGARIAMRVAAMFSDDSLQGARTENLETVGEITVGGTISLLLNGGFAGIAGGIVFLAIRRWLPPSGWRRALAIGFVLFAAGGWVVLEQGENMDYRRFGIAGVNICLFTLLPFLFGMAIGPVTDWVDGWMNAALKRTSVWAVAATTLLIVLSLPMTLGAVALLVFDPSPLTLLLLLPVVARATGFLGRRLRLSIPSMTARWLPQVALGAVCVVGLYLSAVAVIRIL
jgi:hypothetical protein